MRSVVYGIGSSSLPASWVSCAMAVTVAMSASVTSIKSCIGVIYPGLESLDHISDMFDLFELFFQIVNLGDDTSHSCNLCVGI